MAKLFETVTITTAEYRPCYVDGKKALFHRWIDKDRMIIKFGDFINYETRAKMLDEYFHCGILPKSCSTEKVNVCLAIVEYEDGTVAEVEPCNIRFVPGKMKEYAYE